MEGYTLKLPLPIYLYLANFKKHQESYGQKYLWLGCGIKLRPASMKLTHSQYSVRYREKIAFPQEGVKGDLKYVLNRGYKKNRRSLQSG